MKYVLMCVRVPCLSELDKIHDQDKTNKKSLIIAYWSENTKEFDNLAGQST